MKDAKEEVSNLVDSPVDKARESHGRKSLEYNITTVGLPESSSDDLQQPSQHKDKNRWDHESALGRIDGTKNKGSTALVRNKMAKLGCWMHDYHQKTPSLPCYRMQRKLQRQPTKMTFPDQKPKQREERQKPLSEINDRTWKGEEGLAIHWGRISSRYMSMMRDGTRVNEMWF